MKSPREFGLFELYERDPIKADALLWGRVTPLRTRRGFLKGLGSGTISAAIGASIPYAHHFPGGLIPAALAETPEPFVIQGKEGVRILNDRPINAETPVKLLDEKTTSNRLHFVRNNGLVPERAESRSLEGWSLVVDGEVEHSLKLTLPELKSNFSQRQAQLVIECGGNGRAGFNPPAKGNQWTLGAVGCASYRGVRLRDVLNRAGLTSKAVFIAYYGEDLHLSGNPAKRPISRGFPIAKAMDENTLLVWEMNGEPLPALHGFPVRLVCPGWPGSTSGKWLKRIWVRDQVHDGPKMTGFSYRVPKYPVAPGTDVPEKDMAIIEEMPVKSIITHPGTGIEILPGKPLELRGHAWSGSGPIKAVHISFDFGMTWKQAQLSDPVNPFAWQHWSARIKLNISGYYEIWARATDRQGRMQPMIVPGWNPRGYLNNAMQRIAVIVA